MMHGDGFGQGYKTKRQELEDQRSVGGYQNPTANLGGDAAGTVADHMRFGPAIRQAANVLPGVGRITSPLADAVIKMFGISSADEIPRVIERQATRDAPVDPIEGMKDVGEAGLGGAGAAVLGSGVSKGLSVGGSLIRSVGKGLVAADDAAAGMPRSIYTRSAANMGRNFTGDT